jgi:hypothetical protein
VGEALARCVQEGRLADAGLAGDQHGTQPVDRRARNGVQREPELLLATNEFRYL